MPLPDRRNPGEGRQRAGGRLSLNFSEPDSSHHPLAFSALAPSPRQPGVFLCSLCTPHLSDNSSFPVTALPSSSTTRHTPRRIVARGTGSACLSRAPPSTQSRPTQRSSRANQTPSFPTAAGGRMGGSHASSSSLRPRHKSLHPRPLSTPASHSTTPDLLPRSHCSGAFYSHCPPSSLVACCSPPRLKPKCSRNS